MPRTARRQHERSGRGYVEWGLTIYGNSRPNCLLTEFGRGNAQQLLLRLLHARHPWREQQIAPAFVACRPSLAAKKNAALLRRFSRAQ